MKCQHCNEEVSVIKRKCPKCGEDTGSKVYKLLGQFLDFTKKFFSVKRNVIIFSSSVLVLLLVIIIISATGKKDSSVGLSLSSPTTVLEESINTNGGTLTVDDTSSPIVGLSLEIEPAAYDESLDVVIKTQEIKDHDFGSEFNPITPLITIDELHTFANAPMMLSIPIDLEEDEFAMGFFYDDETKTLEAIPTKNITQTEITLMTNHFSSVVVSKIDIAELENLTQAVDSYTNTGFVPGIDDWQFTNYGSYLAPGGHCAGQVLSMAWYYQEKRIKEDEPALYGRFDNVGFDKTEDFWMDDALGYRFASVIQNMLDFQSQDFYDYLDFAGGDEKLIYYAFSYAMHITKTPQLMAIYSHDTWGNIVSGHAILAYKMQPNKIYVADPNYPGQDNRFVEFNTTLGKNEFEPYSSGANAQAILDDGALLYDEILFVGNSALIDFETISDKYEEVLDQTIGNDVFPTIEIEYLDTYDSNPLEQEWLDYNESITLGTDHNSKMACFLQNQIVINVNVGHTDAVLAIYDGTDMIGNPILVDDQGMAEIRLDLAIGNNDFGIMAIIVDGDNEYYADFKRISIDYAGGVTTPCEATIVGRYNFYSRSDGQNLVQNHYIEIYSNGTFKEQYTINNPVYTSENTGTWELLPGSGIGEEILRLTMVNIYDDYEVLDNYQWLRYTSGDIVFLFQKAN